MTPIDDFKKIVRNRLGEYLSDTTIRKTGNNYMANNNKLPVI